MPPAEHRIAGGILMSNVARPCGDLAPTSLPGDDDGAARRAPHDPASGHNGGAVEDSR
jgi:hypothetical protein